ncbi:MAG TPA: hypothetical protein VFQ68_44460 [Streptosporangiaceae bacterium]|nr:hypothetical protein [Streptosporangiaceae bacterium]
MSADRKAAGQATRGFWHGAGFNFLSYRVGLTMMLAVAVTGAPDCRTARELIGLHPAHPSDLATFTSRLRRHGILEPVTAAICQLARQLEDNGSPIDYARRRRLPRLAQAQLDVTAWRRQRHILRRPATWGQPRQPGGTALAAAPVREHLARLRLIELLTGTHPRYLPGDLQLPPARTQHYSDFTLTMPAQLDLCLRRQASSLLSKASIDEPVTWEPPPGWVTGIPWPGPHPDSIGPGDLHPLIRARLPAGAIAAGSPPPPTRSCSQPSATPRHASPPAAPRPHPDRGRPPTASSPGGPAGKTARARPTGPSDAASAPPTRTGSASSTRPGSGASRTSPPKPASRSRTSPRPPSSPASPSGTASTAAPTPWPASADPARSPRPSGTPSPGRAPNSASTGSSPSPASPASATQPASSASGTPSSPARSASSKTPPAPRSCAPPRTEPSP